MSAGRIPWLVPVVGGAGLVVLAAGLALRYAPAVAWAVAVLGAEYAVWLSLDVDSLNTRAPLVGAGLLLVAELAYWSLEPQVGEPEAEIFLRRLALLAGLVLAATAVGVLALAVAAAPLSGGVGLTAGGIVAAVVALALIARLATGLVARD